MLCTDGNSRRDQNCCAIHIYSTRSDELPHKQHPVKSGQVVHADGFIPLQ